MNGELISMTAKNAPPAKRRSGKSTSPGRPEGGGNFREEILDAAEIAFAHYGFAGASLRDIVERVNVTQALVNYYFGSKNGLFREVYLRRGLKVSEDRMENLRKIEAQKDLTVEDIVRAFLSPAFEMRATPGGRAFIRLQARLHTEPMESAFELRRQTYDESTRAYAEVLHKHLPYLSKQTVYWRLLQMIGAYLYIISDAHRAEEISEGEVSNEDDGELLEQLVAFCTNGLKGPEA